MERVTGISESRANWITKVLYRRIGKRMGLVPKSKTLAAHHTPTLLASSWMDSVCASAREVAPPVKELVQLKVAAMVGCPF
jgi:alkylhydroperoxidase family enzyme